MNGRRTREFYQLRVTNRELAAILAGLRLLQEHEPPAGLLEILTNGRKFASLTDDEIDALSERLNAGED